MLILNTLSVFIQLAFIVFMSLVSTNIIRYFFGASSVRKMGTVAAAVFLNHGGGPLPLLGDKNHVGLTQFLRDELKNHLDLKEIKAIILVTAHWEEDVVTISSGEKHELYYDYYGFPPISYTYEYPAPGDPVLANRIHLALKEAGIPSKLNAIRGWDHGVFVPMMLINPEANIPIVQMSILSNQDPEEHYKIGEALQQFRGEGIAIFGSGMSYHNMNKFQSSKTSSDIVNKEFDDYLDVVCSSDITTRKNGLVLWRSHHGATEAHPMHAAEHLMPLIVVAGAGGSQPGERIFQWDMAKMFRLGSYIWRYL